MTEAAPVQEIEAESTQVVSSLFTNRGVMKGHNCAITSLEVSNDCNLLVSGSRDKTALVWRLAKQQEKWGIEETRLVGHNHFVSGVSLSVDATHLLTSSWDKMVRLWELGSRSTKTVFSGHKKDVLAVTFSPGNRHIVTCGRDKSVKLWNVLGECKVDLPNDAWATCVDCSVADGDDNKMTIAVGFWNGSVKLWSVSEECKLMYEFKAHEGRVTSVVFSPGQDYVITGGSDRKVCVWKVADGANAVTFSAQGAVNAVTCRPTSAWVCAATCAGIQVWDIQDKELIDNVIPKFPAPGVRSGGKIPDCTALAWQDDGAVLYSGYSNGEVYAWETRSE